MAGSGTKGGALGIATALIVAGLELVTGAQPVVGAILIVIGVGLFVGHQVIDDKDKEQKVDDIVEEIGFDTFRLIAEESADTLKEVFDRAKSDADDPNRSE